MGRRRGAAFVAIVAVAVPSTAGAASLYTGPGSKPGPGILYAKRPAAAQLTNRRPWKAKPILVSGATSYRRGEFLYQDFLYDDSGARHAPDKNDPRHAVELPDPSDPRSAGDLFSKHNGTYTYPTGEGYANNAADLVELRVKPLRRTTAFRVTLNTMKDPTLTAFTIAIGGRPGEVKDFPFGANVKAPAQLFLTVHPDGKKLVGDVQMADGKKLGAARVRLDRRRRQVEARVPHRIWNPRRSTVRLAAGVGLWDSEAKQYLVPGPSASETTPGGAGDATSPAAFFNVAFRGKEPFPKPTESDQAIINAAWWRDRLQGSTLRDGDISQFFANVSFRKLRRHKRDDRGVPKTGPMDRIYGSRFELSQGADFAPSCITQQSTCPGQYQGRLQPYAIYVPKKPRPVRGYGLTLLLHSLSANYNQYLGTRNQSQFGERGAGTIVITPEARGPDEFYENYGAADTFDVWSDVAHRFKLDPDWTVITGYSMGGIGTFKLGAQFPDLFARAQPTVGNEGTTEVLASLRNVPVLMWNNHGDELVNESEFLQTAQALDDLGYRYELDAYQPCAHATVDPQCSALFPNHLQLAINDWYKPAADFLGTARVDRNPAHVTYVVDAERNHPELNLVGDHAYWVSDIKPREGADLASIDAVSHGMGVSDPPVNSTESGTGSLDGGNYGSVFFTRQAKTWGAPPPGPVADRIDVKAEGVESAIIDTQRAHVSCNVDVKIDSDGPLTISLARCNRIVKSG